VRVAPLEANAHFTTIAKLGILTGIAYVALAARLVFLVLLTATFEPGSNPDEARVLNIQSRKI
jgi:hypothetical protein